ncbi:hypothetical protein BGS_1381 [Beggiatoa sp. SS]|nr:hypothetical protein BGS_1381 [Beggiatoa sp. SS]
MNPHFKMTLLLRRLDEVDGSMVCFPFPWQVIQAISITISMGFGKESFTGVISLSVIFVEIQDFDSLVISATR